MKNMLIGLTATPRTRVANADLVVDLPAGVFRPSTVGAAKQGRPPRGVPR